MKLYELTNDYTSLLQLIDSDTEIPADALADTLESIELSIADKADGIACILKDIDGDIAKLKAEEDRLAERRNAKKNTYDRMKQYLSDELQRAGIGKIETERNKITFRKSKQVRISDEAAFIEWAKTDADNLLSFSAPKVNKTAVKDAIESGKMVRFAEIVENQNIQLK